MNIPGTVEALLSPDAPLALRLTGQLLLGVVRIYAYKVNYLHQVGRSYRSNIPGQMFGSL